MRILYIRSGKLQVDGAVFALDGMGHEVGMYPFTREMIMGNEVQEQKLESFLARNRVDFILSVAFVAEVARAANRSGVKYAVWCMDSPAYPAWVPEADYDNCYLFYFDYREYELKKKGGQSHAYHLPLCANIRTNGWQEITDADLKKYGCDMSFVGTLYTRNAYDDAIEEFPEQLQDEFTGMIEQSAFVWNSSDGMHMSDDMVRSVQRWCPGLIAQSTYNMTDEYYLKSFFLERKLTNVERTLLVELLAERYNIHLYTRDTERVPEGVNRFPEIVTEEALKVYYASKINLNITLRSINSGIPARVFEVMSVGGFVMSNWQEEIPELFVEGQEIVTYKTPEELIDKADYYLKHDDQRAKIGLNGYKKVASQHTYEQRLAKMISIIQGKE